MPEVISYHISMDESGKSSLTIVTDENVHVISGDDARFPEFSAALVRNRNPFDAYTDATDNLENAWNYFTELSENVKVWYSSSGEHVLYYKDKPIHSNLANTILRYKREGRDATNLIKFLERLEKNPSMNSRKQLFDWSMSRDLTIDTDGYIIAYKGVSSNLSSIKTGKAYVDGALHSGHIPNSIGSVVSMPREEVSDNQNEACSAGLHVGNFRYASTFGPVVLVVRIDPKDVVSVPADSGSQKMRVCKYTVVDIHESTYDDLDEWEPEADYETFDAVADSLAETGTPVTLIQKFKSLWRSKRVER